MNRGARSRGISLMETSAALSLMALFIAVFVSLSSRLAAAQSQQAGRAAAIGHLQGGFEKLKEAGPSRWTVPSRTEVKENGTVFQVEIVEIPDPLVTERSFAKLRGTVRWGSVTGDQVLSREIWVHAHLD